MNIHQIQERVGDVTIVDAGNIVNKTRWDNLHWIERCPTTEGGLEFRAGFSAHLFCVGDHSAQRAITVNDQSIEGTMHAGQWSITPANDYFRVEWDSTQNATISQVCISDEILKERLETLDLETRGFEAFPSFRFECDTLQHCRHLLRQESCGLGFRSQLFVDSLTQMFIETLITSSSNLRGTSRLRRSLQVAKLSPGQRVRALSFIHENLSENPSLKEVALAVGLSPFHFARQFKRTIGKTLSQYQLEIRIEKARQLLLRSTNKEESVASMNMVAIALACGFCDQSHLNRAFKRTLGVTPGQYLSQE